MRHLLTFLLLLAGLGCGAPAAPTHHGMPAIHALAMPGGCHDDGGARHDSCLGCAIATGDLVSVGAAPRRVALVHRSTVSAPPPGHPIGCDPPPPRRAA